MWLILINEYSYSVSLKLIKKSKSNLKKKKKFLKIIIKLYRKEDW
jgi:hypothetical protein